VFTVLSAVAELERSLMSANLVDFDYLGASAQVSDSEPSAICAETATMCLPEVNRNGLVVPVILLTNPVASAGTCIEPSFTRLDIPGEIS
jgi:hypothetical protein